MHRARVCCVRCTLLKLRAAIVSSGVLCTASGIEYRASNEALPAVTRLRTLLCFDPFYADGDDFLSETAMRDRVLPALRANASLRELSLLGTFRERASVREAEELDNTRAAD